MHLYFQYQLIRETLIKPTDILVLQHFIVHSLFFFLVGANLNCNLTCQDLLWYSVEIDCFMITEKPHCSPLQTDWETARTRSAVRAATVRATSCATPSPSPSTSSCRDNLRPPPPPSLKRWGSSSRRDLCRDTPRTAHLTKGEQMKSYARGNLYLIVRSLACLVFESTAGETGRRLNNIQFVTSMSIFGPSLVFPALMMAVGHQWLSNTIKIQQLMLNWRCDWEFSLKISSITENAAGMFVVV